MKTFLIPLDSRLNIILIDLLTTIRQINPAKPLFNRYLLTILFNPILFPNINLRYLLLIAVKFLSHQITTNQRLFYELDIDLARLREKGHLQLVFLSLTVGVLVVVDYAHDDFLALDWLLLCPE